MNKAEFWRANGQVIEELRSLHEEYTVNSYLLFKLLDLTMALWLQERQGVLRNQGAQVLVAKDQHVELYPEFINQPAGPLASYFHGGTLHLVIRTLRRQLQFLSDFKMLPCICYIYP